MPSATMPTFPHFRLAYCVVPYYPSRAPTGYGYTPTKYNESPASCTPDSWIKDSVGVTGFAHRNASSVNLPNSVGIAPMRLLPKRFLPKQRTRLYRSGKAAPSAVSH